MRKSSTPHQPCHYCRLIQWTWITEPGDPLYNPTSLGNRRVCDTCRERYERLWLVKATPEQLLTVVNYDWAPPPTTYPRYLMSVQEMYQRRLAGESFEGMFAECYDWGRL